MDLTQTMNQKKRRKTPLAFQEMQNPGLIDNSLSYLLFFRTPIPLIILIAFFTRQQNGTTRI